MTMKPTEKFNWQRIAWGRPDSRPRPLCAYCAKRLGEHSVPITLYKKDGSAASFCHDCAEEMLKQGLI